MLKMSNNSLIRFDTVLFFRPVFQTYKDENAYNIWTQT
uniref:Uncharacterized protein n=1 Tax=Anguilla anguilla TaxID=7936 RepID=A0A0E9UZQ9_ANGAN